MKAKRSIFLAPVIFGTSLKYGVPALIGFSVIISGLDAHGADILRGGGRPSSGSHGPGGAASGAATPAATDIARANARDVLARTNRTRDAILAMQNAARIAALANSANHLGSQPTGLTVKPLVPNGLGTGGLQVAASVAIDPGKWTGANAPTQTVSGGKTTVTIKQTAQQALLNWDTFNVGKKTTLTFDQSAGGADVGKWIAFNKISDPSGNPTQILGSIKADGQVYIINQNGIIFGGGSQVNARSLTASSLPINNNLIGRGLLNNPDAQFLFSGLSVPGGADGTPNFDPGPPPSSGHYGDVTVQAGAMLTSPAGSGGDGGRIMLVGPNVSNAGTISTESGQTILAAGLQVAVAAHDGSDPSLRGLDVWVGAVGEGTGTVTNTGIIQTFTGNTWMTGRHVNQLGIIDSSTSVNLNGRIDLKASYGAVANQNFDSTTEDGAGGPMFFYQSTGTVILGEDSVTRILPDYESKKTVPGTTLPERSQINIEGLTIHFDKNSSVLAPNAVVTVRAGSWPYRDANGDRTVFDNEGLVESGLSALYSGKDQQFFFNDGQIFLDDKATINVAGSLNVFVPLSQSVIDVQLRGPELADSPLLRDSFLRGATLTVDIRNTGTYNGTYWVGTPLGDVTGLAGLIQRNAAQLTAVGGNINLQAGGSIVVSKSASLDVSGGSFLHEGGLVKTSALIYEGKLIAMENATPDKIYEGIFNGESTYVSAKWGVVSTIGTPFYAGKVEKNYIEGAAGGSLSMTAPSMALDGDLRGSVVVGERQRSSPPVAASLRINFEAQKILNYAGVVNFINYSPTPPAVTFATSLGNPTAPSFALMGDAPQPLPEDRQASVVLSNSLMGDKGFGKLEIINPEGSITVPSGVTLSAGPLGSISLAAANIEIQGQVDAVGGKLSFTAYNISPSAALEYSIKNPPGTARYPRPKPGRGIFTLSEGATISTAAELVNDFSDNANLMAPIILDGGAITINSYIADLAVGSQIDASGGAYISSIGKISYGKGGSISILTGKDPGFSGVIGGGLKLGSTLSAYSGTTGGSLTIQSGIIQIGGTPRNSALNLNEDFFSEGGFTKYSVSGIGAAGPPSSGAPESYVPAVNIAPGTHIIAQAQTLIAQATPGNDGGYALRPFTAVSGIRAPVSLNFNALGSDDPFTIDILEVRGDILMGAGSSISTDPGAAISFKGGTVTLLGSVIARGGTITLTGAGSFPLTTTQKQLITQALPTVHLGEHALLTTAGISQLVPDVYGKRVGKIFAGGSISVSGNIVAESGSVMDVSGSSGVLDLDPLTLSGYGQVAAHGLGSAQSQRLGIATRIDSNGGTIDLSGSQMLLCDSTLRGAAGGSTALGGTLSVSSGNYYVEGASRTGADLNLVVKQTGNTIINPGAKIGVGVGLFDLNGDAYGNSGAFSVDRFEQGQFASLSLGGKYFSSASPIPFGGNVDFRGPIDIHASGTVRLAGGGVIQADSDVKISASYIALGQNFRPPAHPDDVFIDFQVDPAIITNVHNFAPTFGTGSLAFQAQSIDVGTLSLQNIGTANLIATNGDIRGNGTLNIAGDLVLKAAQVTPTTLGSFNVFAYDHSGVAGSVTIQALGSASAPLSAGGSLSIYASSIVQSGVLRAPLGTIHLGWDGSGADPDKPYNTVAGSTIDTPVTKSLLMTDGSLTSVTAKGLEIPYGISTDGLTWIDPSGVNVTLSGLPHKQVLVSATDVDMNAGAVVDLSGGGTLFSSRWLAGNGGSKNLLGTASSDWSAAVEYEAGALVLYNGETWSARTKGSGVTPGSNIYWTKVADSFAIVPDYGSKTAPYSPYNAGGNAEALGGNHGYVSSSLKVGDTITLEGSDGLPAGTYTLLPRGYAALDGAFLVTPVTGGGIGSVKASDGATYVSGFRTNTFNSPLENSPVTSRFEIASSAVIENRVAYSIVSADDFVAGNGGTQPRPADAGYAAFIGVNALHLDGALVAGANEAAKGGGAMVDISSSSNFILTGNISGPDSSGITLDTHVLESWGVQSLLIGGVRKNDSNGNTVLNVMTESLTLDNPGEIFTGPEIILASRGELTVTGGSGLESKGTVEAAMPLLVVGNGTLLRASGDVNATVSRSGVTTSSAPLMTIGASANISASSLVLDSSSGMFLSPDAVIIAKDLTLSSGQISVSFDNSPGPLEGSEVENHLVLAGVVLENVQKASSLKLLSYRSIDFYGSGGIGGSGLDSITLSSNGLRGYRHDVGDVLIHAKDVTFENSSNTTASTASGDLSGVLNVDAETIHLGSNQFSVTGYQDVSLSASSGISFAGNGGFSTSGNLHTDTAGITGTAASNYVITADNAVIMVNTGTHSAPSGGLGVSLTIQGSSINAASDITLPSGQLILRATDGPVEIGGNLSVAGSYQTFDGMIRYSDGGSITLDSQKGDVSISPGGSLSVSATMLGGNAGTIAINAPNGVFNNAGNLEGHTGVGTLGSQPGSDGSFVLDVRSLPSDPGRTFDSISLALDHGGFFASRDFRIRTGDITISNANRSHLFSLSVDQGSIGLTGSINASGTTGGSISLSARNNLTLFPGSILNVTAEHFNSAGKGGSILLEAGTQLNGVANTNALLDLQSGSEIQLGVADYVAGSYTSPGSSAFEGKFTGTLHLRAPRTTANNDVRIRSLGSAISGASSIVVEGFKVYIPAGGILNIAQRNLINTDSINFLGTAGVGNANETKLLNRLLSGAPNSVELQSLLVISPGVEMVSLTGDLVLGLANNTAFGSSNPEASSTADWDLSGFRYGSRGAPGVLTLRAAGDIIFNNTLSDGFTPVFSTQDSGHSTMWLAPLKTVSDKLPVNTQSWSYRLTAGADLNASNYHDVLSVQELNLAQPSKGSVIVGEFYPALPNSIASGSTAAIGSSGQTVDSIKISTSFFNLGTRYEVVRTGTGDITISAGRDVQLRNQFSTIYTAGVALAKPTTIYTENDFVRPVIPSTESSHPAQDGGFGVTLGAVQQLTQPAWSMAGGDISINAGANIGRYTMLNGVITDSSSRQMPNNWLYRRGFVDPSTGLFSNNGGFGTVPSFQNPDNIHDFATSTTWWIDYSNFFQGVGALGGGNITLEAGQDVVNLDAVTPTNARMPGRKKNPDFLTGSTTVPEYINLAPDATKLVELGGGDVSVRAGRNIDGGVYYVERGSGVLFAGGEITTNASRTPSLGSLSLFNSTPLDSKTWLPTTLYVGKSHFDVTARGDVLIGPVSNPFLLPQGINNKFWYKTYFNTYSENSGANIASYGGDVTHRNAVNLPGGSSAQPILSVWFSTQNLFTGQNSVSSASFYQPWLRLAELDLTTFGSVFQLNAPNLQTTSFNGDINLVGSTTLFPSATGNLELAAAGGINGLNDVGPGSLNRVTARVWTYASINVSDASPDSIPGIASPLAYQVVTGPNRIAQNQSAIDILQTVNLSLSETGSTQGEDGTSAVKQARHSEGLLHLGDTHPIRLTATSGNISGVKLFSPKATRITAAQDITDVSFYLQNLSAKDISLVSAGRDIVPFDENASTRSIATNINLGNRVGDTPRTTLTGNGTNALAGDILMSGPGVLEIFSGRNLDLGAGANFTDGTGTGITTIGNTRNPYLPFEGADIIALAGVSTADGTGPATGLSISDLDFTAFIEKYINPDKPLPDSEYLKKIGWKGNFSDLDEEQKAIAALGEFYRILRETGRNAAKEGNYDSGSDATEILFGKDRVPGEILTRAREIRTTSGGSISLATPGGGISMASVIFGNPLTPPGIVTEYGGAISTFTDTDVSIGQARIFTLRGGDIIMWSTNGNIAAGTSPRTVVTAPPTRVVIDITSADVQTDLGGLATGGGIGVLAAVEGVKAGNIDLIAPKGFVDAGDAGIRVTGNLNIAAQVVLNSGNISVGGTSAGAAPASVSAPSVGAITSATNSSPPVGSTIDRQTGAKQEGGEQTVEQALSIFTVEVIGYGGAASDEEDEDKKKQESPL